MSDINLRSDSVNVEQIMEQIRARIREKRGVDYTEQQIQDLANVKLEKFLDPRGVRSDLLDEYRRARPPYNPPELPNYAFEDSTLFETHRGPLRFMRKLLNPILKLFFNPNPLVNALNIQSRLNTAYAEREARREAARHAFDQLNYEVIHNLVVETTRMGIEVKNLKMRIESLTSRLEFNERRSRALESVVVYKPSPDAVPDIAAPMPEERPAAQTTPSPSQAPVANGGAVPAAEGPGQKSRRRRRRRGRRGTGTATALMGAPGGDGQVSGDEADSTSDADAGDDSRDFETADAAHGESESDRAHEDAPVEPSSGQEPRREPDPES